MEGQQSEDQLPPHCEHRERKPREKKKKARILITGSAHRLVRLWHRVILQARGASRAALARSACPGAKLTSIEEIKALVVMLAKALARRCPGEKKVHVLSVGPA